MPDASSPAVQRLVRRRRARRRQDQPRPVRDRARRHPLARLRHLPQPDRSRVHRRRLELGLGGRGRDRDGRLRARHRHRRLGPGAGRVLRDRRPEADARAGQHRAASSPRPAASTACRCSRRPRADARAWCSRIAANRRRTAGPPVPTPASRVGVPRDARVVRRRRRPRAASTPRSRQLSTPASRSCEIDLDAVPRRRCDCSTAARSWPSVRPRSARSPRRTRREMDPTVLAIVTAAAASPRTDVVRRDRAARAQPRTAHCRRGTTST